MADAFLPCQRYTSNSHALPGRRRTEPVLQPCSGSERLAATNDSDRFRTSCIRPLGNGAAVVGDAAPLALLLLLLLLFDEGGSLGPRGRASESESLPPAPALLGIERLGMTLAVAPLAELDNDDGDETELVPDVRFDDDGMPDVDADTIAPPLAAYFFRDDEEVEEPDDDVEEEEDEEAEVDDDDDDGTVGVEDDDGGG